MQVHPLPTLILSRYTRTVADNASLRLDIWLDVACIFKTRSQAQTACKNGRVEVNGDNGKAHRAVRPGDGIKISLVGKGIAPNRLTAVGYGEDLPIASNMEAKGRATNRRVELVRTN